MSHGNVSLDQSLLDLLLLFEFEVLVDDVLQAGAVWLDVALQLCVVQGTNLIVVKLLIKLHTHMHTVRRNTSRPSQGQVAST